ncbi:MAG: hypothetical protein JJE30_15030 [Desulfuromonadales bacterium]|nr:hypothetical protein [Desulfuromonadales bacterium]
MLIALKKMNPLTRCYLNTSIILLSGWSGSIIMYLTAEEIAENPFAEFENSKRFANSVERMGGKSALLANELAKWFNGVWQGESLAYTTAFITFIIAVIYYFIASDHSVLQKTPQNPA